MARKDEIVKELVDRWQKHEGMPSFDELKNISIHLREISGGRFKADYTKTNQSEMIAAILEYDESVCGATGGSHCLPEKLIESIQAKKSALESKGEWTVSEKRTKEKVKEAESEKYGEVIVEEKELYPYETKIPQWIYLGGVELFAKMLDGEKILVGQVDGDNGYIIHGNCDVEKKGKVISKPSSVESCAIALTVGKISKILELKSVLETALVNKGRYVLIVKKDLVITDKISMSLGNKGLVDYLKDSPSYKKSDYIYVEKVTMKGESIKSKKPEYEVISATTSLFRKPALTDAGRVFMFEMVFGINDKMNQFVKKNAQSITKVYTNPRDVRIRRILDVAYNQAENAVKKKAEEQFTMTKDILDDAMFIEGMNEVRLRVASNSKVLMGIIDKSSIPDAEKDILKENIETIEREDISLADIIEWTFNGEVKTTEGVKISPLKHRSLKCTSKKSGKK